MKIMLMNQFMHIYQTRIKTKTCMSWSSYINSFSKYKNQVCSFCFKKPFPKLLYLQFLINKIRCNVDWHYVDNQLYLDKLSFFEKLQYNFHNLKSISEVLQELGIAEEEYQSALKISDDQDFHLHVKWSKDYGFANNCFAEDLLAWENNIDIQSFFQLLKQLNIL